MAKWEKGNKVYRNPKNNTVIKYFAKNIMLGIKFEGFHS